MATPIALKPHKNFIFNNGVGNLLFFKRHSNLFLVFLDSNKQHIVTLTSGFCKVGKTKKQKVSALNLGLIIKQLKIYINLYNVNRFILSYKQKLPFFFKKLGLALKHNNIIIFAYHFILCRSHGSIRGRTPRRV